MRRRFYTEYDIDRRVTQLKDEFEAACQAYKDALGSRESNRAKKELMRGNTKGTNIYKFQVQFAWILHDIHQSSSGFAEKKIQEAEGLISHIHKICDS